MVYGNIMELHAKRVCKRTYSTYTEIRIRVEEQVEREKLLIIQQIVVIMAKHT